MQRVQLHLSIFRISTVNFENGQSKNDTKYIYQSYISKALVANTIQNCIKMQAKLQILWKIDQYMGDVGYCTHRLKTIAKPLV